MNTTAQREKIINIGIARNLFKHTTSGAGASIVNASLITAMLWNYTSRVSCIIWLSAVITANIALLIYGKIFYLKQRSDDQILAMGKKLNILKITAGILFGSSSVFLFPHTKIEYQVLLSFVLGGMASGAIATLGANLRVYLIFAYSMLIPIMIRFVIIGTPMYYTMLVMMTLFALVLTVAGRNFNQTIRELFLANIDLEKKSDESLLLNSRISEMFAGITTSSNMISKQSVDATERFDETDNMIRTVSTSLSSITSKLQEIHASVTHMNSYMADIAEKSDKSQLVLEQAVNSMEMIEKSSNEITNIIEVINEIAFKTNLLSLNAAIEAARAGDTGKGFAVVADSVRELANQTSAALENIRVLIKNTSDKVHQGKTFVDNSALFFNDVLNKVRPVSENMREISSVLENHAKELVAVDQSLSKISIITIENSQFVHNINETSQELKEKTRVLFTENTGATI